MQQSIPVGKGIYVTTNIWEALAYARPQEDYSQTFLVVDLMTGPIVLGSADLVDFGQDAEGKQVLTTTDVGNTILCAAYSNQMLATYLVKIRFNVEIANNSMQKNTVRTYHEVIWNKFTQLKPPSLLHRVPFSGQGAPASGVVAAAGGTPPRPRAHPAVLLHHSVYNGIAVGDRVRIQKSFNMFKFCDDREGTVRAIYKYRKINFCVEVDGGDVVGREIQAVNHQHFGPSVIPNISDTWVRCWKSQVTKI